MNRIIKKSLQAMLLVPALALGVSVVAPVLQPEAAYAVACEPTGGIVAGKECAKSDDQPSNLFGDGGIFTTIVNVLLFIIGAVAVIMLIYGGIRYVLSGGDASAVTAAKNTILYAIVGIIVAILAYAIVNFVITRFTAAA
jgi:hypothetical protein